MSLRNWHTRYPGRFVVGAFVSFIALGTLALWLPVSQEAGTPRTSIFDALFTACSAVTVTGLGVLDTGSHWSRTGEVALLVLMQIGGLGIMTLASMASILLSKRLRIGRGLLAGAEIGLGDLGELAPVLRSLIRFSFGSEAVIALLLTIRFVIEGKHTFQGSLWLGIFHSVSAFNNAGFSTLDGGLARYVADPAVSLIVAGAIILGGLGFPVAFELSRQHRKPHLWSLHTKITLMMTGLLLAAGTATLLVLEWTNPDTLGNESIPVKVLGAFFQSTTARTAGFNTIDIEALRGGSILVMILLMVIGASSASTGGGIKTTTFAVVVATTLSEFRGAKETSLFNRTLDRGLQRQALALVVAAAGTIGTATFLLSVMMPDVRLDDLLFEATSAFGTVGLSTGITTVLNTPAQVLIIILMFVGRVGPATFGSAFLLRSHHQRFRYPEEKLIVG